MRGLLIIFYSFLCLGNEEYKGTIYLPGEYTISGMFSKKKDSTEGRMTTNFRNGEVVIFDIEGMDQKLELSGIRKMKIRIDEKQDTKLLKDKMLLPGAVRIKAFFVDIGEEYKPPFHLVHPSRLPSADK